MPIHSILASYTNARTKNDFTMVAGWACIIKLNYITPVINLKTAKQCHHFHLIDTFSSNAHQTFPNTNVLDPLKKMKDQLSGIIKFDWDKRPVTTRNVNHFYYLLSMLLLTESQIENAENIKPDDVVGLYLGFFSGKFDASTMYLWRSSSILA